MTDQDTGELLCILVKNAIPPELLHLVEGASYLSYNRGDAAGLTAADTRRLKPGHKLSGGKVLHPDGRRRDKPVKSNTVGYTARNELSYWTRTHPAKVSSMRPFIERMMLVYKTSASRQFQTQRRKCTRRFLGLPLSAVVINNNFRCAVHKDVNDLPGTLGVMAVAGDDSVQGGELIFPEYDLAVDVRKGDMLLFNSELYHGNARFAGKKFSRISVVAYGR